MSTAGPYVPSRRDTLSILGANIWLRLTASRRCRAVLADVYQRGLASARFDGALPVDRDVRRDCGHSCTHYSDEGEWCCNCGSTFPR